MRISVMNEESNNNERTGTKEQLIVSQYESFTANERQRESSVIQLTIIIGSIIAGFGIVLTSSNGIYFIPITYSILVISILAWLIEHILNSSYQFRIGQAIQSKIRESYDNLDDVIPAYWNNANDPDRPILINNYKPQFYLLIFLLVSLGIIVPLLNGFIKTNTSGDIEYLWYLFNIIPAFILLCYFINRRRSYQKKYANIINNWKCNKNS